LALQDSSAISEENKKLIEEISSRSNAVFSNSQESVLTTTVAKTAPAVVSIVISKDVPLLEVEYIDPFGRNSSRDSGIKVPVFRRVGTQQQQVGAGTGFFIRADGYILTNKHVVDEAKAEYTVLLSTGEKKNAKVTYRDDNRDIAILKVEGEKYPVIPLGNSSDLKLGQTIAAIGNALGEYGNSVSVGIVSGLNRTIEAQDSRGNVETLSGVIQTDAAINRGNSGGPLLDLSGKAVGINVAMQQGANNIAFAIPTDNIKPIIDRVLP
jgi:serine protease Do